MAQRLIRLTLYFLSITGQQKWPTYSWDEICHFQSSFLCSLTVFIPLILEPLLDCSDVLMESFTMFITDCWHIFWEEVQMRSIIWIFSDMFTFNSWKLRNMFSIRSLCFLDQYADLYIQSWKKDLLRVNQTFLSDFHHSRF